MSASGSPSFSASRVRAISMKRRSEEHTSELQSLRHLVCRLLLEKKNVGDQREEARIAAEHLADRQSRLAPHRAVAVGKEVHRPGVRHLLAAKQEAPTGHSLVDEA